MSLLTFRLKTLILLCGLPCSGKSTFARVAINRAEFVYLSSDALIEDWATSKGVTYADAFTGLIRQAQLEIQARYSIAIAKRQSIILDQTNMSVEKRTLALSHVPDDYQKVCFVFPEFSDHAYRLEQRNASGGKVVPLDVLESMKKSFVSPSLDEGWDSIQYLSEAFVESLFLKA